MRILAVTNMYPTLSHPALGVFVEQQIGGLRMVGVEVDVLFVDRLQEGMSTYRHLPRLIHSRLRHVKADVVHVMYGGVMAAMATHVVGDRPIVVTFHGSDLLGEHLSGKIREAIAAYGVWCSCKAARRANGVVVVSQALQDRLPRNVDRSKVRIIPCGIDLTRFTPLLQANCREQIDWRGDAFRVLFNSSGDDPRKRLCLARTAVEALKRMGIPTEMRELRGIKNSEVPVWLNASDVLLLTSSHEGSPTIVKEALACNVPVVSLDVGDVRQMVQEVAGCYLASPDPEDLAEKLRRVYAGPRRVSARHRMRELTLERVAIRLKEFYAELSEATGNTPMSRSLQIAAHGR